MREPTHNLTSSRRVQRAAAVPSCAFRWCTTVLLCLLAAPLSGCAALTEGERHSAVESAAAGRLSPDIVVTPAKPPHTAPASVAAAALPADPPKLAARAGSEETRSPIYVAARLLVGAPPVYPDSSRRVGEAGSVALRTRVMSDGKVDQVEVVTGSGFAALDQAAVKAVSAWTFAPATRDGAPMASLVTHTITFKLEPASR
jgi:TonB family protein